MNTPAIDQAPRSSFNDVNTSIMKNMDQILHALRSRKIPFGILHAIINLHIANDEKMNLRTLAASINVTTAAVTNIADTMENLGFARRLVSSDDRRTTVAAQSSARSPGVPWIRSRLTWSNPADRAAATASSARFIRRRGHGLSRRMARCGTAQRMRVEIRAQ